ncbi:MAG: YqhA family protein [Gammaproteobacteria bacterium]
MGRVDFGELKLKLLTSIVAISAVHLLESYMNINQTRDRELAWTVIDQCPHL